MEITCAWLWSRQRPRSGINPIIDNTIYYVWFWWAFLPSKQISKNYESREILTTTLNMVLGLVTLDPCFPLPWLNPRFFTCDHIRPGRVETLSLMKLAVSVLRYAGVIWARCHFPIVRNRRFNIRNEVPGLPCVCFSTSSINSGFACQERKSHQASRIYFVQIVKRDSRQWMVLSASSAGTVIYWRRLPSTHFTTITIKTFRHQLNSAWQDVINYHYI